MSMISVELAAWQEARQRRVPQYMELLWDQDPECAVELLAQARAEGDNWPHFGLVLTALEDRGVRVDKADPQRVEFHASAP